MIVPAAKRTPQDMSTQSVTPIVSTASIEAAKLQPAEFRSMLADWIVEGRTFNLDDIKACGGKCYSDELRTLVMDPKIRTVPRASQVYLSGYGIEVSYKRPPAKKPAALPAASPSGETTEQELARLRAENEALKAGKVGKVGMKVSAKGALSVYGLGRFPVTLYEEQWEKLLAQASSIQAFIKEHHGELSRKSEV